ncbi:MAG: ADP-ribosylglycohydrolase family protein [Methanocalculus sp.]|uniref:ADP-ribosylglycohydrolase family protein n=1 Tax=Methanocalculus sp. TaxID=2004547 RepID=UPI00271F48D3|nr:ADP-ribosylglycohydrolase family protein [Methanocalculus sp.]MDO9539137.1 ADP-ribosylglycohydrolase family protein [Methanocalculus sp.]
MIFIFQFTRIPGTLIGSAIGDAMGAPFEGSENIAHIPNRMIGGGPFQARRGEYTDDTLQTIALAETLVTCRGFSTIDFLSRLVKMFRMHPEYFGRTSSTVLLKLIEGIPPEKATERSGRTNGAVMRGSPIGIFYRPDQVLLMSRIASETTHGHPVAVACSGVVNQMISILCRGGSRQEAFFTALESCEVDEVRRRIALLGGAPLIPSIDALDTTHAAITCFMECGTFKEMILRAISLGGDTDTTAAICGALGGAYHGVQGIPGEWIADLEGAQRLLMLEEEVWNAGQR